jgi:hypothetical protein
VFTKQPPVSQFLLIPVGKFKLEPPVSTGQFWCKKNRLSSLFFESLQFNDLTQHYYLSHLTPLIAMESDTSSDSDSDNNRPSSYTWILLLATIVRHRQTRTPSNRSWTGQGYVNNLLHCGNPTCIRDQLRMELETFYLLRNWLVDNTKLNTSRYISVEEKLVIFIFIASSGASNYQAQEQFNCSSWTISQ